MTTKVWPWTVPEKNPAVQQLAEALGLHRLTAACLTQRGVTTTEAARLFLAGSLSDLGDPFKMAGMAKAAERLALAVREREPVLIYGDYDADGVTSTALLMAVLQKLEVSVEYYIPSRLGDGYGLHGSVLEEFAGRGGKLAVTVDCGINSFAEMELAKELGLDLIVTDHHECFDGQRNAFAVLNPKQEECGYSERNLAGVGVAWNLARALHSLLGVPFAETAEYLDLVAVGSIADVVPLLGENRILVKYGLEKLSERPRPGLAALARVGNVGEQKLSATQVAFVLAPRLNAPGRLGDAAPAVETLLADEADAEALAHELDEKNRQRQQVEKDILAEARELAAAQADKPALVLWRDTWHPGVVGIVAGRLASEFAKPSALVAVDGTQGNGSIRSVPGCDVVDALQACTEHLARFGGHPEAAGLTVDTQCLEAFREAFCRAVATQKTKEEQRQQVAAEAVLAELSLELVEELAALEPFGQGNPEPLFLVRDVEVAAARRVGNNGKHLQMKLKNGGPVYAGICFGGGEADIARGMQVDAVVFPTTNTWQGRTSLSLHVRDVRQAQAAAGLKIIDRRRVAGNDKYLENLAGQHKLLIWVNTKAAKESLEARLGSRVEVTQLGRNAEHVSCDMLVFYHLPFDQNAVGRLLGTIKFSGEPEICLCYGSEELHLNERIFAATIPSEKTLQQLAACLEQSKDPLTPELARKELSFPVTQYLVNQARTVFAELAGQKRQEQRLQLANLEKSETFCQCCEALAAFRKFQALWWEAPAKDLARHLTQDTDMIVPEGENLP
ncbi:single-stranded-DNA-specific exonuclease RecJ [Dethiobacter alkaliphilus]|uniref:Single-stranded-DNA-specific exonuclease RecJ n=1 Tax=Dethiobacter alkaliphilus AHT 1 TaxID=555088 RepID=C0GFY2_DETAL|nr:single-stranded-DNA-specific exonuclease RecJ [Dethiobacter alkaliphilus]EEG77671.1 single-stranded-DNA-specific exonuclease RecJ [Dethiobacter alkaliphilus AHT 1]